MNEKILASADLSELRKRFCREALVDKVLFGGVPHLEVQRKKKRMREKKI